MDMKGECVKKQDSRCHCFPRGWWSPLPRSEVVCVCVEGLRFGGLGQEKVEIKSYVVAILSLEMLFRHPSREFRQLGVRI